MSEIPKRYNPAEIEDKWYAYWEKHELFKADPNPKKKPFTIMMPPPNVTGKLHMGHALQGAVQDMLIRLKRMQGYEALWIPGTDHAGIATQSVVEKDLKKREKKNRHDLGRDAFVDLVWKWKDTYGSIITGQYRKLGTSPDWSKERFTMDEGLSKAVQTVFVKLHEEGLIYKGSYLVNWCPHDMTAISDEEVDHVERKGHLWHVQYELDEDTKAKSGLTHLTIATTRPETIPADTAIAVNPEDERYLKLVGGFAIVPTNGKRIPIIADDYVGMDFGTGCLKVTPAHDQNDFEIGQRHGLQVINIINTDGTLNKDAGQYEGLDRFVARKKVVEDLTESGHLVKEEDYINQVGISSRSGEIIEPLLSEQWFVKMEPLAKKAIEAFDNGEFAFFPDRWKNEFLRWMSGIRDWVISRQLWWGHRIPVWYYTIDDGSIDRTKDYVVSVEQPEEGMIQDPDVLDTWFSSWLWPFSTLGWPDKTAELAYFYPTSVLVSGYDIIFFWVSRMLMGGLHFMGEKPFEHIFLTGLIKDKQGRKMSKSLGNGIDPLDMISQYGADAVRYSLIILCAQGQDIKLDPLKFEMGRNFANKIWNAYRFLAMNMEEGTEYDTEFEVDPTNLVDQWMLSKIMLTLKEVDEDLSRYRINEALLKIYSLIWDDFADWYIELLKPAEYGKKIPLDRLSVAMHFFEMLMKLLHPSMPYITEEIWQRIRSRKVDEALIRSSWPVYDETKVNTEAITHFTTVQKIISTIRNIRAELKLSPKKPLTLVIKADNEAQSDAIKQAKWIFDRLENLAEFSVSTTVEKPKASNSAVIDGAEMYIPLEGLIDIESEKARLEEEIKKYEGFQKGVIAKLNNPGFVSSAPEKVVAIERQKQQDNELKLTKLRAILADINS